MVIALEDVIAHESSGPLKLGISTWSLPWSVGVPGYPQPAHRLDAIGLLGKAVEQDVHVVQLADNLPLHELPASKLDRLKEEAAAHGLDIEIGTRGLDPEHLARYITIADRLGARALRTVLGGSMCGAEEYAAAESAIGKILRKLQEHQVLLAVENNEAFSSAQFSELMQRIGSPLVGMCLDTANSLGRPEPLQTVLDNLAGYAVMLHAKDYDIRRVDTRMGFSVVGQPAGEGRVDFGAVLSQLAAIGRRDISVIIEHWPPFTGNIETTVRLEEQWLSTSVRFLRPIVMRCDAP